MVALPYASDKGVITFLLSVPWQLSQKMASSFTTVFLIKEENKPDVYEALELLPFVNIKPSI